VLVRKLFDSGKAYSFVSSSLIKSPKLVDFEVIDLPVSIPTGITLRCTKLFKNFPLKIKDCVFFLT
jgi:hypothetical protein